MSGCPECPPPAGRQASRRGAHGYPGSEEADADVQERCRAINDAYVAPAAVPSNAELYYYVPTKDSWRTGGRTLTCACAATEGKLTGSLQGRAAADDPRATGPGSERVRNPDVPAVNRRRPANHHIE
ncbi:hypothetical protein HW130_18390 [Streptomyces sp. PKU-EA00015]|uniref:hypothetical protein n=1 Tax=Streptomyces sp. PKU-EA00015 TaxID=2748326 RepID=UPI0015A1ADE9|nr:hypothetical protein [Streptomyces sp. PKU-EA00015]NWF28213.1 hypothetical protein [Streptomyces sp. PKU-EA00015]